MATDVSVHEQMCVTIRWFTDNNEINKDPIGLIQALKTECLPNLLYVITKQLQAANMSSGHLHGVAACIKSKQPAALHVHCLSHSLNLCLQDAAHTCTIVRDTLGLVMELYKLIKYFPKCASLFEAVKSQMSPKKGD